MAYHEVSCTLSLTFLLDISFNLFLVLFIAVNEVSSKHSQTSRSFINFQGKNSHFHRVSGTFETTFQITAFLKEFKDLYEP